MNHADTEAGRRARARDAVLVFVGGLVLAVLLTYPAILHLRTRLIGAPADNLLRVWHCWHVKHSLVDLRRSPLDSDLIFHPHGMSLTHQVTGLPLALASVPLQCLIGLAPAFNLLTLATFALAALSMFLLARYITRHRAASLLAAFVFAWSPYMVCHAVGGHLSVLETYWLPLYVLFLLRTLREPGARNAVAAAVCLIGASVSLWYYAVFCAVLTVVVVVYQLSLLRDEVCRRGLVLRLAIVVLAPPALLSPLIASTIRASSEGLGGHPAGIFSADLQALWLPGVSSAYREFYRETWLLHTGNTFENATYLGWPAVLLGLYGLLRWRNRRFGFWGLLIAVFAILAMGPRLHIAGQVYDDPGPIVPLPYALLEKLPGVSMGGVPMRAMVLAYLALAVLVALTATGIAQQLSSQRLWRLRASQFFLGCVGLAMLLDQLPAPMPTTDATVPEFYLGLRDRPAQVALFNIVERERRAYPMYWQTAHGHRQVSGYAEKPPREPIRWLHESPVVGGLNMVDVALHNLESRAASRVPPLRTIIEKDVTDEVRQRLEELPPDQRGAAGRRVLRELGVRYVTLIYITRSYWEEIERHWIKPDAGEDDWQRTTLHRELVTNLLENELGLRLVGDDRSDTRASVRVYEVPED